jgi:hypothetical protein
MLSSAFRVRAIKRNSAGVITELPPKAAGETPWVDPELARKLVEARGWRGNEPLREEIAPILGNRGVVDELVGE